MNVSGVIFFPSRAKEIKKQKRTTTTTTKKTPDLRLVKSGPCTYDSKYFSQIDRFCERAVKYGYIAKFTPTAVGSEIKSAEGGGELKIFEIFKKG